MKIRRRELFISFTHIPLAPSQLPFEMSIFKSENITEIACAMRLEDHVRSIIEIIDT